jgi:hypothetical protein
MFPDAPLGGAIIGGPTMRCIPHFLPSICQELQSAAKKASLGGDRPLGRPEG